MDDSVGSSSSPPHHPTQPPAPEYPAHLANLHVTIPCRTPSDALLSSLSVALAEDLSSTVIDAFLQLFHDPAFRSAEVTFRGAQDIARHISEQRKRIAQRRSLGVPFRSRYGSSSSIDIENENETRNPDIIYGRIPQLIVDMAAQQLSSETETFSHQVDWDTTICNFRENRSAREQDLLNMTLAHRTWTYPATRALRSRVKIVGSRSLQSFLRSPRMGSWIRELYFIESLENENAREMMRLLEYTLRHTPNLRQLAIRTWWRIGTSNQHDLDGVIRELGNMKELQALWLFTNRGHIGCLPTLVATLPDLKSLRKLYLRNWMVGSGDEGIVNASLRELTNTSTSGARLSTLSFVDGALSETSGIFLPWLLHHSPLTNLEIHTKDLFWVESNGPSPMFTALLPFLPSLKTLRLHYSSLNGNTACRAEFIKSCSNVRNFSMVVGLHHELNEFPEGVETVHVHFSTIWPVSGRRLAEVVGPQRLEKLKRVVLTKDPVDAFMFEGGLDVNVFDAEDQNQNQNQEGGMGAGVGAAWNLDELRRLCESRRVELSHEFGFISFEQLSAL